ncbi:hypothetical protein HY490_05805 [Candidatus Woesearchaeota archaeon]|nr:hypothetical protein [Candidatus Woesearchaeota archaeon]
MLECADKGDVLEIKKYIGLSIACCEAHGLQVPEEPGVFPEKYKKFFHIYTQLKDLHWMAYQRAIRQNAARIVGHALTRDASSPVDRKAFDDSVTQVKDLYLDCLDDLLPPNRRNKNVSVMIEFFNKVVDPFFAEVADCARTANHPLRDLYTVDRIEGVPYARTVVTGRGIVRASWYHDQWKRQSRRKIPVFIDAVYERAWRLYSPFILHPSRQRRAGARVKTSAKQQKTANARKKKSPVRSRARRGRTHRK